jgi:hypothetical protein
MHSFHGVIGIAGLAVAVLALVVQIAALRRGK